MRINASGKSVERRIRAGYIGCGSHSFRNVLPAFQFAPIELVATCDLDPAKAKEFARAFGATASYSDYHEMLRDPAIDAVFVVTGYDRDGRPLYPTIAVECLRAGKHVWIEKPPAASIVDVERMRAASLASGKQVMVGFKKMFMPANEKAKELQDSEDFGGVSMVLMRYPQYLPEASVLRGYFHAASTGSSESNTSTQARGQAISFLDHICHPVSLMLLLLGMPRTLHYDRSLSGGGVASFTFASGAIASLALTDHASSNGGMESTFIVSAAKSRHIIVDNNLRVSYHRHPGTRYGSSPSYFVGGPDEATAVWDPEFSLGQLYNKGVFLLGYVGEVTEFANAVLDGRAPSKGTLEHAWQATRIAAAFAEGPGKTIALQP